MNWPIVPLCDAQLTDVNPADILENGLYRKCNIYKGGGGYDKFPIMYQKLIGTHQVDLRNQFVAQVLGCPLDCPYCYVTREGVYGEPTYVSTHDMVMSYHKSGCSVFHLMGGAPAIYLPYWLELLEELQGAVFHSDLMLIEREYDEDLLKKIAEYPNQLHAVSIKGYGPQEFESNTRMPLNERLFDRNYRILMRSGLPVYFTFTGMSDQSINKFKKKYELEAESFSIDLIDYNALHYSKE